MLGDVIWADLFRSSEAGGPVSGGDSGSVRSAVLARALEQAVAAAPLAGGLTVTELRLLTVIGRCKMFSGCFAGGYTMLPVPGPIEICNIDMGTTAVSGH